MIYVMSDIHGQKRRFDSVMKQINLQPDDTLYILGDVIDRNPDGIKILRQIMAMPNAKMLLGNHELMMMVAIMLLLENGAWAACRAPQSPAKVFQTEQAARDYLSDCESVIIIDL